MQKVGIIAQKLYIWSSPKRWQNLSSKAKYDLDIVKKQKQQTP